MLEKLIEKFSEILYLRALIYSAIAIVAILVIFLCRNLFISLWIRWRLHRLAVKARPKKIVVKDTQKWPLPNRSLSRIVEIAVHGGLTYLKVAGYVVAVEGDPCRDPTLCYDQRGSPVLAKTWSAQQLKIVARKANELLVK